MFSRVNLFIIVYAVMVSILNISLLLLGESRVDAYIAVNVLVYYIAYAVIRPFYQRNIAITALNIVLILLFTGIVALRIYEVIAR